MKPVQACMPPFILNPGEILDKYHAAVQNFSEQLFYIRAYRVGRSESHVPPIHRRRPNGLYD